MAGVRMPLESYPLQALVSEPVKPVFPCVVMSNTVHAYISQSDKGELVIGAGTDQYISYSQTGGLHILNHTLDAICEMFPIFTRMKMLRSWGGIVDVTPDRSPILAKTPVPGLYVNCGWGTGGFKATPGSGHVFAHTIANDNPHPDQRAVHAGALPHRPADRRGGGGRRRALRRSTMLLIRCPYCEEERPELEFRNAGEAHIARSTEIAAERRRGFRKVPVHPLQPQGPHLRALAAHPWLRALLQRRARHRHRQVRDDLQGGRAEAGDPVGSQRQRPGGLGEPSAGGST